MSWRTKINRIWFTFLLTGLAVGCRQKVINVNEPVHSFQVKRGTIVQKLQFVGNVGSSQSVEQTWKTSGVVEKQLVQQGDQVIAGQILAALSDSSLPKDVIQAEFNMIQASEELNQLFVSETKKAQAYKDLRDKALAVQEAEQYQEGLYYPAADRDQILASEEKMNNAKEAYELAKNDYQSVVLRGDLDEEKRNKYQKLQETLKDYAQKNNSYIALVSDPSENLREKAAAAVQVAQADYQKALEIFKTYQPSFVREQDQAQLETKLDAAMKIYNYRNLIAEIDGKVSFLNFEVGKYVRANESAVQLDNLDNFFLKLNISEFDRQKLVVGMKTEIQLDAQLDKVYRGIVQSIADRGTSGTSGVSYETIIQILDPDEMLRLGMTAQASVVISERQNALLVPNSAVYTRNEKQFVDVVNNDIPTPIEVTVGLSDAAFSEITTGNLNENDMVRIPEALNTSEKGSFLPEGHDPIGMEGTPSVLNDETP